MTMQEDFEKEFAEDLEPIKTLYVRHAKRFNTAARVKAWLPGAEKVSNATAQRDMLMKLKETENEHGMVFSENIQALIDKLNKVIDND